MFQLNEILFETIVQNNMMLNLSDIHLLFRLHISSYISVVKAAIDEFATVLDDGDQKSQLNKYIVAI